MLKKISTILLIFIFSIALIPEGYGNYLAPDFLCEVGMKFYRAGRYAEALQEFKKALLLQANYAPALEYIAMIEQLSIHKEGQRETKLPALALPSSLFSADVSTTLDLIELQREMIQLKEVKMLPSQTLAGKRVALKQAKALPLTIFLDESIKQITHPVEIEQGKSICLAGKRITRFLIIEPRVLDVTRKNNDEILVTGKEIGYSYLYAWDESGRWTVEFLTVPAKPEGETLEERMRLSGEGARNFTLAYSINWSLYEKGRRINALERQDYSYTHNLALKGETPYGKLDAAVNVNRFQEEASLGGYTLGLTDGQLGSFNGFSLRGFDFFDYPPEFSNLVFPGISLRGGMLSSPAFKNKLTYTLFAGRENWAGFGNLAPGLNKKRESFLSGVNLDYSPFKRQDYRFTIVHGWGSDRRSNLNPYGYDLSGRWGMNKYKFGYEIGYDSENFAHIFKGSYRQARFDFSAELRDINKKFLSITGNSWRQGELGGLFNLNYRPTERWEMGATLDTYQERLYPAPDNEGRWNEDVYWHTVYHLNNRTYLRSNYVLQNELGRISQFRYQSADIGISQVFKFIKDIDTYFTYYHQENTDYSSPNNDYVNDRIYSGLKFSLSKDLYYYLYKEVNWLQESYNGRRSQPNALETGLDYSGQIGKTPFYGDLRFTYRDEEDATSSLGFLSGEDYIEGFSRLSYRPKSDFTLYGSCRVRNVWADNPQVAKRVEASINLGMSYLWDTGLSWQSVCNIEGYVFKDYNADGLRQRNEPPIEGVKVWLGKNKSVKTDIFGYYNFKGVRGRKAHVTLDTASIPAGFVLTVPITQEAIIRQNRTVRLDFGMVARSEISGYVFEDIDGNGEFNKGDKGIRKVGIILDEEKKLATDETGRYVFARVAAGEHKITLDLNSLPVYYLPTQPITKKITLFEGVTYYYNIPLKRSKEAID